VGNRISTASPSWRAVGRRYSGGRHSHPPPLSASDGFLFGVALFAEGFSELQLLKTLRTIEKIKLEPFSLRWFHFSTHIFVGQRFSSRRSLLKGDWGQA
jgi:hypothetical protein